MIWTALPPKKTNFPPGATKKFRLVIPSKSVSTTKELEKQALVYAIFPDPTEIFQHLSSTNSMFVKVCIVIPTGVAEFAIGAFTRTPNKITPHRKKYNFRFFVRLESLFFITIFLLSIFLSKFEWIYFLSLLPGS